MSSEYGLALKKVERLKLDSDNAEFHVRMAQTTHVKISLDLLIAEKELAVIVERTDARELYRAESLDLQIRQSNRVDYVRRCALLTGMDVDINFWADVIAAAHKSHFNRILLEKLTVLGFAAKYMAFDHIIEMPFDIVYRVGSLFQGEICHCTDGQIGMDHDHWKLHDGSLFLDPKRIIEILRWPGEFTIDTTVNTFQHL